MPKPAVRHPGVTHRHKATERLVTAERVVKHQYRRVMGRTVYTYPGDWAITDDQGEMTTLPPSDFEKAYTKLS